MTVRDLINTLAAYDLDMPVWVGTGPAGGIELVSVAGSAVAIIRPESGPPMREGNNPRTGIAWNE